MAEIVIAKHRSGAVGEVLLRFKGEFTRFSNPDDDMIIPAPNAPAGMMGSRMNSGDSAPTPPPPAEYPAAGSPFEGADGPLPF